MKQKWVDAFMDTAERFAQLSSAVRLQVGAVVVKDNRIISIGYNGMPSGWTNQCEHVVDVAKTDPRYDYNNFTKELKTKDEVIHAEANAIIKLARDGESGNGSSLFCTHAPCIHCAKLIHGAGIDKVYYRHSYRDEDGVSFLQKCKINVEKVDFNSIVN
jgi:dCMP deaminase